MHASVIHVQENFMVHFLMGPKNVFYDHFSSFICIIAISRIFI